MVRRSRSFQERQRQFLEGASQAFRTEPVRQVTITPGQIAEFQEQRIQEARQQRATKSVAKLNREIALAQTRLSNARQRLASAQKTGTQADINRARDSLRNVRDTETQFISRLKGLKSEAATGQFLPGDIISFAGQQSVSFAERTKARSKARGQLIEQLETGLGGVEAREIVQRQEITTQQAQRLSPELRQQLGIPDLFIQQPTTRLEEELSQSLPSELRRQLGVAEAPRFQGPVRPGFDVEAFRETGRSVRIKDTGFLSGIIQDIPTIGDVSQRARAAKTQDIIESFQALTPAEAERRALAGEKGFVGQTTQEGTLITFDPSAFEPEIRAAGKRTGFETFIASQVPFTLLPLFSEDTRGRIIEAKGLGLGSQAIGVTKFGVGITEFGTELAASLGVQDPSRGKRGFLGSVQLPFFDEGVFKTIKEKPSDIQQIITEVGLTGGTLVAGVGALNIPRGLSLAGKAISVGKQTAQFLSPIRPVPGIFAARPDISRAVISEDIGVGFGQSGDIAISRITGRARLDGGEFIAGTQRINVPVGKISRTGELTIGRQTIEQPFQGFQFKEPTVFEGKGGRIFFDEPGFAGEISTRAGTAEFAGFDIPVDKGISRGILGRQEQFLTLKEVKKTPGFDKLVDRVFVRGELVPRIEARRVRPPKEDEFILEPLSRFDKEIEFVSFRKPQIDESSTRFIGGLRGKGRGRRRGLDLSQELGFQTTDAALAATFKPEVLPKVKPPRVDTTTIPPRLGGVFAQESQFAGLGQFERTEAVVLPKQRFDFGVDLELPGGVRGGIQGGLIMDTSLEREFVGLGFGDILSTRTRAREKTIFRDLALEKPAVKLFQPQIPRDIQIDIQRTGLATQAILEAPQGRRGDDLFGGFLFDFGGTGRLGFGVGGILPGLGIDAPRKKKRKGKRRLRRTPSLIAIELDIELPRFTRRQERTGLVERSLIAPLL